MDYVCVVKQRLVMTLAFFIVLVMATMPLLSASLTASATSSVEELVEDIIHIHASVTTMPTSLFLLPYSLFPVLIIRPPLFLITQHLIGLSHLLEFLLCSQA